jgi:hypothetical protein
MHNHGLLPIAASAAQAETDRYTFRQNAEEDQLSQSAQSSWRSCWFLRGRTLVLEYT